ncbi:MAG: glycosyltransferase family 39 protein [Anaerolineae bacterium]|nr:glycosyltransferase family 39 protein [Anaerolineae bacterium]
MKSAAALRPTRLATGLFLLLLLAVTLHFLGLRRELPYIPLVDESAFVPRAMAIVATGDLNPGWFGHPGSTLVYPLALVIHLGYVTLYDGVLFHANPAISILFEENSAPFFMAGRVIAVIFGIGATYLTYRLGRRLYDAPIGLLAGTLFLLNAAMLNHAKWVRTDSASVFFVVLSLLMIARLLENASWRNQLGAGIAIGLGLSTKYSLAPLVGVLLLADGVIVWRAWRNSAEIPYRKVLNCILGLVAIGLAFAFTTPYFFLDFATAWQNLALENRSVHPGADGLSPVGNLWWYLSRTLWQVQPWPIMLAAVVGTVFLFTRRTTTRLVVFAFIPLYMIEITLHALHWLRWLLPLHPLLSLLAAVGIVEGVRLAAAQYHWPERRTRYVTLLLTALILLLPVYRTTLMTIRHQQPTTNLLAREWIQNHIEPGTRIAQERYGAPLDPGLYDELAVFALGQEEHTVDDYRRDGIAYLVISSAMYDRFLAEPERYVTEAAFYNELLATLTPLVTIEPSLMRSGPTIHIFALPPA